MSEPLDMDQDEVDVVINRYGVETTDPGWLRLRRPPLTLDRSSALCLIGWVAKLLRLTDEEIRAARDKIEAA